MECLDDCHRYEMDLFLGTGEGWQDKRPYRHLAFYEMRPDGTKTDGVTNEEVLRVLIHRLKYLNDGFIAENGVPVGGQLKCRENSLAITKLEEALMWLEKRTADRIARKAEGTHKP